MNKKIDLYFNGDYIYSTTGSKTCKEAKTRLLESSRDYVARFPNVTLIERQFLKRPDLLKARFSK